MAITIDPAKRKIEYRGKADTLTIEGDLVVTGSSTLPGVASPTVTSSVAGFTVGTDLTVTQDSAIGRDEVIVRDLTVGRGLLMSGASGIVLTLTDTTTPCTFDITMADTTCTLGTTTNHSLIIRTNNTTALTIAGSGAATFAGAVTVSGTAITLSNATTPTLTITDTTNTVSLVCKSGDTVSTVGTSTNHDLQIITNNTLRITVSNAGVVTNAGALTNTGAVTITSTLTVNGTGITLSNATDPVITVTDTTNTCSAVVQALNTTVKIGSSTATHALLLIAGGTTAISIAAATSIATFTATPVMPALTLSGASGVVLTMTDSTTPSTLTITMADTTATIATTTAHSLILAANSVTGITIASTGIATIAKGAIFTLGHNTTPTALTATVDGLTTGLIAVGVTEVSITSSVNTKIITLPAGLAGTLIRGWTGANGHMLQTPASSNATINGQDSDGTKAAAIPATTKWEAHCIATDTWILIAWDELGAVITAIVPS